MNGIGINDYIRELAAKGLDRDQIIAECVKHFNKPRKQFVVAYYKIYRTKKKLPASPVPAQILNATLSSPGEPSVGLSKDEFRLRYSVKHMIQNALISLKKDILIPEAEFRQMHNLRNQPNLRMYLDDKANNKYRGKAYGGCVYYSHPDTIAEMKAEYSLL